MAADEFLIAGLGASAGGIKALKEFFSRVPHDSGIAYVVILHLSPQHESHLAEVLQVASSIPVRQVRERIRVEPNHVYIVPQNQSLSMDGGDLSLSAMIGPEERRSPVDTFFRALADSHDGRAVCAILSGTGANGSAGLKRVKERGGLCLAQSPTDAEYPDMPRNAIATGLIDQVLPVAEMPARIIAYKESLESVRLPEDPESRTTPSERALRDIFTQVRARTGHDFSSYKRGTVLRRIARRMGVHQLVDVAGYAAFLRESPEEVPALLKDLLISVTSFFRDREAFDMLERSVIPKLFEGKGEDDQVRVWVAGCATGEEAYSLAMLLGEHMSGAPGGPGVQIFATDIDENAIAIAREGLYTAADVSDISIDRAHRFMVKEGEGFRVRKELREMILFAHHNILKDPPFAHLDLASCRNLLIYLNRAAQQRILEVLHFALNPGGYLMLGGAESIEGTKDLFVSLDHESHVFQSRGMPSRIGLPMPDITFSGRRSMPSTFRPGMVPERPTERPSFPEVHHRLVELYAPPSVIIDDEHDILHLSEHVGRYLQFAPGEPTHNLLKVVRPELRLELRTALYQAAQERTKVVSQPIPLKLDDRTVRVTLKINPVIGDANLARGFFLVMFDEDAHGDHADGVAPVASGDSTEHLEEELLQLKEQLRATIERHETQAEELKASNEELLAMNEELRSSTEELETSKEELQSLNEELRTVNQELKIKIEEQSEANNDILNLINSTELATVFLDRASRIKLFTPRTRELFNVIAADRGRPLSDISNRLIEPDLTATVGRVLERLERVEREVETRDGRLYLMRVLPYRTAEDRIDGVVLTFLDITLRKLSEERLRASENRLRLMVESIKDYAIFTSDDKGVIDSWNAGAARLFGYDEQEIIGRRGDVLFTAEDRTAGVPKREMQQAAGEGRAEDERWHVRKDGSQFYASGMMTPLRDGGGTLVGYVKIARDLTERKRWEDALRQAHAALEDRVSERTLDLEAANRSLDQEVRDRRDAEARVRRLLARLITVQEDERRRIGRDLHDHVGQQFTGLQLKLDSLGKWADKHEPARKLLAELRDMAGRLNHDLDFLAIELRPAALDDLGLAASLSNFVQSWSKNFGIPAEFHEGGMDHLRLGFEIETNLYRLTQEALNNVYKHAGATHVGVILERRAEDVVLIIEDNGKGFDQREVSPPSLGLLGMRERAALVGGRLEIETAPGRGTTIFVHVPIEKRDDGNPGPA